ncbi:MAG: hypothetical protein JNN15_19865 [Blastocatellia bacterium]|nr:hypothetical protein [Blastocatellia bacterium]
MYVVVYTWRLEEGKEELFRQGWRHITETIYKQCKSFGARLHKTDEGIWIAYTLWPDRESQISCLKIGFDRDPKGFGMIYDTIEEAYPVLHLTITDDLLKTELYKPETSTEKDKP